MGLCHNCSTPPPRQESSLGSEEVSSVQHVFTKQMMDHVDQLTEVPRAPHKAPCFTLLVAQVVNKPHEYIQRISVLLSQSLLIFTSFNKIMISKWMLFPLV